ncbi:hypothetical protein YC2023_016173 [Brassica napus]
MGKEIVRAQSDEPGEREFLIDSKDVCDVLEDSTGTKKVLGISLNIEDIDELRIHKTAFKGMRNLRFLNMYTKKWDHEKEVMWRFGEGFDYLPPKLRFLRLDGYPMKCMPSNFCPTYLVKLHMQGSKLEKLWEGVHILPTGMNLESLERFTLKGCSRLKSFPDISTNISVLDLSETAIEEFPSSLRLENLAELGMCRMKSENLWERVQVDIQLHVSNNGESTFKLKKWGISLSLFKDYSVAKNGLSDQNILPRVYGICHETELGDEPGDDLVETMRCRKRMRIILLCFADYMKHLSRNYRLCPASRPVHTTCPYRLA